MIERFLKLRKCTKKALRVVGSTETLSQNEWSTLQNILNCLHPVEIVLERLWSDDASLLKADSSIHFLLSKLKSDNNSIAAQLHQCLLVRYVSQKQNDAVALTSFFHNLKHRGPTTGPRATFCPRIITMISVITKGLPCVPKIPNVSGNNMAVQKFAQM